MIYIYGLECPIENTIRYIGKSNNPNKRLSGHITTAISGRYAHRTSRWIRRLAAQSLKPRLVILHIVGKGERWQEVERKFIADAESHGWRLTNSTLGGEGLDFVDPADAAAWREKLSVQHKKIWSTTERRAEASERSRKAWSDPEIRSRRLASVKAAHARPEIKARNREVLAAIRENPDVAKKRASSLKASWADPVIRAKRQQAMNVSKMSLSARSRWSDPEKSAKLLARFSEPESLAVRSAAALRRSTPAYRAMMAEKTKAAWASGKRKAAREVKHDVDQNACEPDGLSSG